MANRQRNGGSDGRGYDQIDSIADRSELRYSTPVQPMDDTDVQSTYSASRLTQQKVEENVMISSLDSGFSSLHVSAVGSSLTSVYADSENTYQMNYPRRGYCLIINNKSFNQDTKVPERIGSDLDAVNMYTTFKKLGFDVDLQHNKTCEDMFRILMNYSAKDHGSCDCFAVAILSHGDDGVVYGTNGPIPLKSLIAPLKSCKSLVGKPKLFFIQACQGTNLTEGVDVTDADSYDEGPVKRQYRIPQEADFLYAYSTTPGAYAFRNSNKGSWFVQALCKVFQSEQVADLEITRLLTRVNRIVAEDYESKAADRAFSHKKQMPCIVSMLRKDLYLRKK